MFKSVTLSDAQRRIYASEKTENFRWVARILARHSSFTLTSSDLVSSSLEVELAEIGQFAELAHGTLSPEFIWANLTALSQPDFPLEGYNALRGSILVSQFRGTVAALPGYVAHRPDTKQLIVAFSGTPSFSQTLYNCDVRMISYPGIAGCAVHAGFWYMHVGVRDLALNCVQSALHDYDVDEVVLTGHSLGSVMCYLFALYILIGSSQITSLPPLKIVVFGSPRVGNLALAKHWQQVVDPLSVTEYSVKAYNDGATALPPYSLGYRHFTRAPMYLAGNHLFHIPLTEFECSDFAVKLDDAGGDLGQRAPSRYPRGGHNYYNNRDMEKLLRRMGWLQLPKLKENGWEERYRARIRQQQPQVAH